MTVLHPSLNNSTIIGPVGFYVTGFTTLPFADVYFIFLAVLYVITVLLNMFLISVIFLEHSLHTPKYIAVANLAVVDLGFSTAVIPEMMKTFLFKDNFVPVNLCLSQMFFCYLFFCLETSSLCVLAYDRLIAICFPLRQHSINTAARMICILAGVWIFCVFLNVYVITVMSKLYFCESVNVYSHICHYSPVLRLACSDYTLQFITAIMLTMSNLFGSLSFIIVSYVCILVAVFRMKTVENRKKALATCTEHLILVAVFYVPTLLNVILDLLLTATITDLITLNSLATSIPPFMNPLVYSFKAKEIRTRASAILRKIKIGSEL